MSITRNRCVHCRQSYTYHPSFYGGEEVDYPYNHESYCPECYQAVKEALSNIPVKFEKRFIPSDAYTKEQIIANREQRKAFLIRVLPTLIDTTGKDCHNIVCELMPDNEWYMVEWWESKPEDFIVRKEAWVKLSPSNPATQK
jgi:hypothetical protein